MKLGEKEAGRSLEKDGALCDSELVYFVKEKTEIPDQSDISVS